MKKIKNGHLRTWIEIDQAAVKNNYRTFRRLLGSKTKLLAVVKSNAYGHGLIDFARLMSTLGVDWLGVDSIVEALGLRREGIRTPILVFGYTQPSNFAAARRQQISLTISTFDNLRSALRLGVKIHLKLDTGMHRQGFLPADLPDLKKLLAPNSKLVEGVYSHLAAADDPAFDPFTKQQISNFSTALTRLDLPERALRHLAATSGAINWPSARFDLARVGLGLYGHWPSPELEKKFCHQVTLRPVLTWKTIVGEVKTVGAGEGIGYDLTEIFPAAKRVAICPIGYWHGYPRALSGRGEVAVRGRNCRVLGRVSMDMIAIDVSAVPRVKPGDEVILLGRKAPAETLAKLAGTSNYEILTRLNPLIKRFYI